MALIESTQTKIGSQASDFNLPATDGKNYSLNSFANANGLVVIFTCNHCPYAKAAWPLLIKLASEYKEKGVSFVGINPNDEKQYPEDSFEVMKQKTSEWQINFPYLRNESQEVARTYNAQCTPDIFVFDRNRKLYYRGRINNNWPPVEKIDGKYEPKKPDHQVKEELKEALNSLLANNPPPSAQNPSMGCSIKWKNIKTLDKLILF
ncbi:hypothetical protein A3J17_01310 [Candidatus Curtissbacteria bacterium RIFCSPLOWO2_02_FULL_40_11]|uniref:Thioredoxin domain-containing protein n=1 Tax=Candidatus Curtissbacteria bacterium RIFCSPLOWO2_12_FULL_38_9 TaxID=1797735 RepID=A0A1F5ICN6_9BACT|nr:MAG: hypothetical protein A3J17_01310 [Candidatus Curtissbacteria bacterium RIFCSPLOWO2_02_FULL_40_11]OGE14049.1 MAG: hypothetical protein A3G14_03465 [Candidatus Curtissbacteria bacterium RIFCSPLOWO2_12_FULL_38_9]